MSFIAKNCDGVVPPSDADEDDRLFGALVRTACADFAIAMESLAPSVAIEVWMRAVFACNQYIDAQAPWALRKTDPERMTAVLAVLYEAIGNLAIAIQPVIPASAQALLDQMGVPAHARTYAAIAQGVWYGELVSGDFTLSPPKPLFPRLELPEAAE